MHEQNLNFISILEQCRLICVKVKPQKGNIAEQATTRIILAINLKINMRFLGICHSFFEKSLALDRIFPKHPATSVIKI